jgi:hypothetical protein
MRLKTVAGLIGFGLLMSAVMPGRLAARMVANHDLSIVLFPERARLEGRDRIRLQEPTNDRVDLFLSPHARIREIRLNGRQHPYTFTQGRLSIDLKRNTVRSSITLSVDYSCRFDDPAPRRPVNTDNPGYGVSGTISPQGTFILAGAGWYPGLAKARETFDLRVDGPMGTIAVTSGRQLEIIHDNNRTVCRWRIDNPLEGMSLSAGPYGVEQKTNGALTAATYLFAENRDLSSLYLERSLSYLNDYSKQFGTYPFDRFAVVENFFPTGYGFPGYTLMGGAVLRLPFIPDTSLPHEIVHNWWGNGVLVASRSGNWCEGLTTYTADYLLKERQSAEAAMDYRRQTMRNYASLVSHATDFPLSHFRSRTDPASKVIGYDKSAMVFHMLREELGDTVFWDALRDLYHQFLFKHASWQDLQDIFENRSGQPLDIFFKQWIDRSGAPQLRLEKVRRTGNDKIGYRSTGHLVQEKPYFNINLQLTVETAGTPIEQIVHISGRQTDFIIESLEKPQKITADPEYRVFRRLAAEEIPPTINTLKGSTSLIIVLADRLGPAGASIASQLAQAMGVESFATISEADLTAADQSRQNLLFIGLPERSRTEQWFPHDLKLKPNSFLLAGQRFDQPTDTLFCVVRNPQNAEKIIALLHPLSWQAADAVRYRLSHYGRYSFLAFSKGRNRVKGTWEVKASPMIVRFGSE